LDKVVINEVFGIGKSRYPPLEIEDRGVRTALAILDLGEHAYNNPCCLWVFPNIKDE
jgi:hypothetical protein